MRSQHPLKVKIRYLYESESVHAHRFRYAMLGMDILTIVFLIASTFFYGTQTVEFFDYFFGIYVALDFAARFWIAHSKKHFLTRPLNIADLVAAISFIAPLLGENFAFLRGLRILRLLRSYRLQSKLRRDFAYFRRNEDIILSAVNLFVFIFVMTEMVFVSQVKINSNIENFLDAMYFTITTLTTTGFGDITLVGELGRLLSVIIMIFGVSLFLRLVQTIIRPSKVRFTCNHCGLYLHENDAVHCKHCGNVLNIPSDGAC